MNKAMTLKDAFDAFGDVERAEALAKSLYVENIVYHKETNQLVLTMQEGTKLSRSDEAVLTACLDLAVTFSRPETIASYYSIGRHIILNNFRIIISVIKLENILTTLIKIVGSLTRLLRETVDNIVAVLIFESFKKDIFKLRHCLMLNLRLTIKVFSFPLRHRCTR